MPIFLIRIFLFALLTFTFAQTTVIAQDKSKFKQLQEELPTPNVYRNAAGAPGHQYWQMRADYTMDIVLDDEKRRLSGEETITYYNNSPDVLDYLWLQLDQNLFDKNSETPLVQNSTFDDHPSLTDIAKISADFDGGFKIELVRDKKTENNLPYTVVKTMMRVELPKPLQPNEKYSFSIKWWYNINDRLRLGGRSGYEYFAKDDNCLYTIAQFFPRMAVYSDVEGWQHKQFLGRGEFALTFGDYDVRITTPADHVLGATGSLQNPNEVLTAEQRQRFEKSKTSAIPVAIVTENEAVAAETKRSTAKKTWHFKAENVRDFAFATSRKFIWDAMGVQLPTNFVMAMSYYPKEGNPLWGEYSTKIVAHTLKSYSKFTFDYPYPVASSVHSDQIGMEYPMICFNFGRPNSDGTYSDRTKYSMQGVIIHEVGHNWFSMMINSDERQWAWLDEGLNSFIEYLTEQAWDPNFPSRRGPAVKIADYMKSDPQSLEPIMTNPEAIKQLGNNAYGKTAAGLNILREVIMGHELFDYAFKTYSNRWKFKHPEPADFFRTMEDASGIDLDWFWRGWFYSTNYVDIAIDNVKWYQIDPTDPEVKEAILALEKEMTNPDEKKSDSSERPITQNETDTSTSGKMKDSKYWQNILAQKRYQKQYITLDPGDKTLLSPENHYYEVKFSNKGGLVMPLLLEFEYVDGSTSKTYIPAEVWQQNEQTVNKIFVTKKELRRITLDPNLLTADTDTGNNVFPRTAERTKLEEFKQRQKNK